MLDGLEPEQRAWARRMLVLGDLPETTVDAFDLLGPKDRDVLARFLVAASLMKVMKREQAHRDGDTGGVLESLQGLLETIVAPFRRARARMRVQPGSNRIDLGDHHLRFVNSFPDSEYLGVYFPGLCGGMSYTTCDYFYTETPAPETTATPPMASALGQYIHQRQVDSLLGWHIARFAAMLANPDDALLAHQTDASFEELRGAIDAGTPIPIGLAPYPFSLDPARFTHAHQVVAVGYQAGEDGSRTVLIWDPNRPDEKGTTLYQAPGALHWIERATKGHDEHVWRGFFVESGYTVKEPPRASRAAPGEDAAGLRMRRAPGEPWADPLAGKLEVSRDGGPWRGSTALGTGLRAGRPLGLGGRR